MGHERRLRCFLLAGLALCASAACNDKSDPPKGAPAAETRCEQLAKACSDPGKHADKLAQECTQAAKKQADKGCADKAAAAYDCYQQQVCGGEDKVWALDDFRVLTERHDKCGAERDALRACVGE